MALLAVYGVGNLAHGVFFIAAPAAEGRAEGTASSLICIGVFAGCVYTARLGGG